MSNFDELLNKLKKLFEKQGNPTGLSKSLFSSAYPFNKMSKEKREEFLNTLVERGLAIVSIIANKTIVERLWGQSDETVKSLSNAQSSRDDANSNNESSVAQDSENLTSVNEKTVVDAELVTDSNSHEDVKALQDAPPISNVTPSKNDNERIEITPIRDHTPATILKTIIKEVADTSYEYVKEKNATSATQKNESSNTTLSRLTSLSERDIQISIGKNILLCIALILVILSSYYNCVHQAAIIDKVLELQSIQKTMQQEVTNILQQIPNTLSNNSSN